MQKNLIAIFALCFLVSFSVSTTSCKQKNPEPEEELIPEVEDDPEDEEEENDEPDSERFISSLIQDDTDEPNARSATIAPENALIVRLSASNACVSGKSLKVYFKEANSISTAPITDAQRKAEPVGTYRSFSIKPEMFSKIVGKTFDRTKSYALYAHDATEKKMYAMLLISSFPDEIVVQDIPRRKAYSMAIVPISCSK